jgi:hypothetical protein
MIPISIRTQPPRWISSSNPPTRACTRAGKSSAWNIEVAVKAPNENILADPRTLPDLQKEAEEWTGLGLHPNIAHCHYFRPIGDVPVLVVEYVPGGYRIFASSRWSGTGKVIR